MIVGGFEVSGVLLGCMEMCRWRKVVEVRVEAIGIVVGEVAHMTAENFEGSEMVQEALILVAIAGIGTGSLKREVEVHSVEETQVDLVVPMEIRRFHDIEVGGESVGVEVVVIEGVVVDVPADDEEHHIENVDLVKDDIDHQASWVLPGAVVAWEVGFVHIEEDVSS